MPSQAGSVSVFGHPQKSRAARVRGCDPRLTAARYLTAHFGTSAVLVSRTMGYRWAIRPCEGAAALDSVTPRPSAALPPGSVSRGVGRPRRRALVKRIGRGERCPSVLRDTPGRLAPAPDHR